MDNLRNFVQGMIFGAIIGAVIVGSLLIAQAVFS